MRKSIFIVFLLLCACIKEQGDITVSKHYFATFYSKNTKTSISEDYSVLWGKGDIVQYYYSSNGTIGRFTIDEEGESANLLFNVDPNASFIIASYSSGKILENTSGSRFVLSGVAGSTQTGRFEDAHASVTKSYDINAESLTFTNLTSIIKFSLECEDVSSVVFSSNGKEIIHGDGTLICSFEGEKPKASFGSNTGNSIRIEVNGPGDYYISTLPVTMSKGFSLYCYDKEDDLLASVVTSKRLSISENQLVNLGVIDSHLIEPDKPVIDYIPNLSINGTANCYIVPMEGEYFFNANVKGNSSTPLVSLSQESNSLSVKVLWESFGTTQEVKTGEVVSNVRYQDGKIYFNSTGVNGNAVIAIINRDEDVVWSWHIWCVMGYDPVFYGQEYINNAGVLMDRNLGATTSNPKKQGSVGLYYQTGRKDPFIGASCASSNARVKTSEPFPSLIRLDKIISSSSENSLSFSISHPTSFIFNESPDDWYSLTRSNKHSNELWTDSKSVYDPCPPGWKVPSSKDMGIWTKAIGNRNIHAEDKWRGYYIDLSEYTDGNAYYPASGYIDRWDLKNVGTDGIYRTVNGVDNLYFYYYKYLSYEEGVYILPHSSGTGFALETALSVRCQRE